MIKVTEETDKEMAEGIEIEVILLIEIDMKGEEGKDQDHLEITLLMIEEEEIGMIEKEDPAEGLDQDHQDLDLIQIPMIVDAIVVEVNKNIMFRLL